METKDRIRKIMEDQHMTQQVFAEFLKQAPATLSSIFNGRTRPTLNVIDAIKSKIPEINVEWLLYGTGEQYITPSADASMISETPASDGDPMLQFDVVAPSSSFSAPQSSPTTSNLQGVKKTRLELQYNDLKFSNKEPRRVIEICVYYDDQTFETFVPAKK